jgi:integrase
MTKRRSKGDGGLRWSETRQRWIGEVTVGYRPNGKRIVRTASSKNKGVAAEELRKIVRDVEDGTPGEDRNYTVKQAVEDWLEYGLPGRDKNTIDKLTTLAKKHVIPSLGARKLRELTADDGDKWLTKKAKVLSTRTLREVHSIPIRAITRAQAREKVKRNVMLLCELPQGQTGRPSKALTLEQAETVLAAAEWTPMRAYIVLSLLIGARTEELRALTWSHVDLIGNPNAVPPVPPHIMVWRSVRKHGDTKTRKSRRSLALPQRCVKALQGHEHKQALARRLAGNRWQETGLVFASAVGTELNAANVRRAFRRVIDKAKNADNAGLVAKDWTPRELRHSFASLLSDDGIPLEEISRLMGHTGTTVTETVYRHQIRPVIEHGAEAMDRIFAEPNKNQVA